MTTPNDIPAPADGPAYDPLPEQEAIFRPAVRFGNVPVVRAPLGWDPRRTGFRNHYPFISLPLQTAERVGFGAPELDPNRLIWGDCLHVMRQLPSETIDLIYIDPPFFSNRVYNVIWGDDNEERSFSDVWQGGLEGYLVWLNARLYEMKRLLKPTGAIYVHCDWHASHYIKVEMDKLFGYENFRNEIVWKRTAAHANARRSGSIHDIIFFYSKSGEYIWNDDVRQAYDQQYIDQYYRYEDDNGRRFMSDNITAPAPGDSDNANSRRYEWKGVTPAPSRVWLYSKEQMEELDRQGRIFYTRNGFPRGMRYLDEQKGMALQDIWTDVEAVRSWHSERLGYPTQKPEALLERIIGASSNADDVVADFFIGGGTTAAVAQRLGRGFIACDQSRVAIAVTAERLKQAAQGRLNEERYPDCAIEQWGIYEAARLADASTEEFRKFVLECYDARIPSDDEGIHGYKGAQARVPVWVGSPSLAATVTVEDVDAFAQSISRLPRYQSDEGLRDGIMLAWGFTPGALNAAEELRGRGAAEIAFVRLEQVRIDSPAFRRHIASQSTERGDYSNFLTFVQPPEVSFAHRRLEPLRYAFDAADTQAYNPDAQIISVQWDFAYDGRTFRAERRPWADRAKLAAEHTFPHAGTYSVACKAQDDKGGEGMTVVKQEVS